MGYGVNGARVDAVWVLRMSPRRRIQLSEALKHSLTFDRILRNAKAPLPQSLMPRQKARAVPVGADINTLCVGRA